MEGKNDTIASVKDQPLISNVETSVATESLTSTAAVNSTLPDSSAMNAPKGQETQQLPPPFVDPSSLISSLSTSPNPSRPASPLNLMPRLVLAASPDNSSSGEVSSMLRLAAASPSVTWEQLLFFACGLGSSICYIATLSCLVYFKLLYGAASFAMLNLAVYLPLLPISMAQARWDQYYDLHYQSKRTFLVRGIVGFGLGLVGTIRMILAASAANHHPKSMCRPSLNMDLIGLVFNALLQGTGGAILYGTLNQLASFVGRDPRALKATVSAGVQASALVVLAVSLVTGFGVHDATCFPLFLATITGLEALCMAAFVWLLTARPVVTVSLVQRDSSLRLEDYTSGNGDPSDEDEEQAPLTQPLMPQPSALSQNSDLNFRELWEYSKVCSWVLAITLVPSFLVGSWFTQVQTEWMALAQWLFYIRIASDFVGRLVTILVPPRSLNCLIGTSLFRLMPVVIFFIHSKTTLVPEGWPSDALNMGLVATIAFLSGYLVTGCFQLAPLGLPDYLRETHSAKQASLLTVTFAVSAVGGLLSSFCLMGLGV